MSKLLVDEISDADNTGPVTVTDGLNVSSGNVGVGTVSPAYPLTLGNNKQFGSLNTAGAAVTLALLNNSNNLVFGDDSVNTGSLTVQSRAETRFVTNGVERLRILSTGGITFNGDTAAANALDDYEEGTWTPVSPTVTFTSTFGSYTKIGNRIFVDATFIVPSTGSGVSFYIDGFPFTSSNAAAQAGFYIRYTTDGTFRMFYMLGSGTRAQAYNLGGGATTLASVSNTRFDFSGAYYTT